ncbi:MAG TPA: carboxypeptidase-like regulatory domain-containing protein [Candidatus Sulfotelmatobacter sp.]|nr:carboxypeptidase-like regulatory domain-containing protein [Candidatus Sulfotelmatobacter sp.]
MALFARNRFYLTASLLLLSIGSIPQAALAQQASANVNGVVTDQTGAAIANAQVQLTNVGTGVTRTTTTNTSGAYVFLNIVPGTYTVQASAQGFSTTTQPQITLEVNQTATFDFHLKVGQAQQTVQVEATAAGVESSTAELGTVVTHQEVNDLPLNGRNFTQLLTITAGVANVNRDQSQYGGGGWAGNSIGSFSFPAVNGARNRSNLFLLDGVNDLNTMLTMYNYAPIVDDIQEFKTQGHNDLAEYGGVAGGIVSVVSKSGTNEYHGTLWEFLRNEAMDSRGYFEKKLPPLRQNQYGASFGGPIRIPHLYDGRQRSFFYAAWEGYRQHTSNETGALGPTDAERGGDFSSLCTEGFTNGVCNNPSHQLYDPATTTFDSATNTYSRSPLSGNIIPADRIDPISSLFQSIIPRAGPLVNGANIFVPGLARTDQDSGTIRGDQNFGSKDQMMFRYSQFEQNVAQPSNVIGVNTIHVTGTNYVGHWTHTFSGSAISDVYFGRNHGDTITANSHPGQDAAFLNQLQQLGMSKFFMTLNNKLYAPQWQPNGYIQLSGSQLQETELADNWVFGGSFTKILGKHTLKAGGDFQTNNFRSPIAYSNVGFGTQQTAGLGTQQGLGGDAWASMLLGVPGAAGYRNILEVAHSGWIDGVFIQDQWKATNRLTVNLGFRNDFVITPIYGTGTGANFYTGNANPLNGTYELNALPPDCSATQGAPCIPTGIYTASSTTAPGGLPPHAYVNPNSKHRVINNSLANWAARVGLAYRLDNKTAVRASYGRFYDAWGSIVQLSQNFGGNWPAVNTIQNNGLNLNIPTASSADPLQLGSGGAIVYPINDFSQVSQWMVDPNFRTPYMDQWNVGVQRELPGNAVIDANYVGSVGRHLDWGPTLNVPNPGAGDVQSRRPYPYMLQQWFDMSVGNSRYNAMQITLNKRFSHGVTFLAAYTLSHSNDDGCGIGANCNVTNPYNRSLDYGTSDLNQTHVFSFSFAAQSPFDRSSNKLVANLAGGWSLNGILQLHSGLPYAITLSNDNLNIGCCLQQRADVIGNSHLSHPTAQQWFNIAAFASPPSFTYGNEKVNPYTTDWGRNFDLSLFRQFHVGLGERRYFEFRAEAFNIFNTVVFGQPGNSLGGTNFGAVTTQQNTPRQLQLGLKFYY